MLKGKIMKYQLRLKQLNEMLIINDDILFNVLEEERYGASNKELKESLQQMHDKIIETIVSVSYQFSKTDLELDSGEN